MKRRTCNQVSAGPLKDSSGQLVTDDESMAEILNEFFCTVLREDATDVPIAEQLYHEEEPLVLVQITSAQVQKKLNSLKPNSTLGPDKLWPKVQQKLASVIATLLAIVHNICLAEGVVPSDWKAAIVTPIFKKGSRRTLRNYRPVSLTCVLCKIMESIIRDATVNHLEKHNLLRNLQRGFMREQAREPPTKRRLYYM